MAEMFITPKGKSFKKFSVCDKNDIIRSEARERKRHLLYLIHSYLNEQKLCSAAEALEKEAQLTKQYQVCENVDLDIILQEYQSYYHTKFQKYPKIVKKTEINDVTPPKNHRKLSSKIIEDNKCNNISPTESEEFQFEIVSLPTTKTEILPSETSLDRPLCDFEHYSSEWREIADQIMKECCFKKSDISWNDCIGLENPIEKLKEALIYPLLYPDIFKNIPVWNGVLLFGPPGTGKTLLAKALASQSSALFLNVRSSTFISKWRGESEKMIRVLFDLARHYAPTTVFIDEIDALMSINEYSCHDASRRFRSELLTQIDGIASEAKVFILGSTNLPWNLDAALLRRFDKRLLVPLPNEISRIELLKCYLKKPNNIEEKEMNQLASMLENFSGSDIKILCKDVAMNLIREKIKDINSGGNNKMKIGLRKVTSKDVETSLEKIKPCTREGDHKKYQEWHEKYGSW